VTLDPREQLNQQGFTLLEVMIAMVILIVGLVSIQAVGIHASRTMTRAKMQSEYAQSATRQIESVADSVKRSLIACGTRTSPNGITGDTVRLTVSGAANRRTLIVSILPATTPRLVRPDTFLVTRDLYVPGAPTC
jgi:prepilin-type N-terminal cleavage/methylation domain-containing protein